MVKMKIGILTVPFNNNYGGFLQAFALMKVLKDFGCKPYMIMRRHNLYGYSPVKMAKIIIKSFFKAFKYKDFHLLLHPFEPNYFIQGLAMQKFVDRYIKPQTSYFYSWSSLEKKLRGCFDALIVGSDQVWRSIYVPGIENYFLDFAKTWNIRRISYAASFGTIEPEYTMKQIEICGNLLKMFDSVSVREQGALQVFNKFGWNVDSVEVVLDPTLLLNKVDYENIIKNKQQGISYLFAYVLDKNIDNDIAIQKVCESQGIEKRTIANIQEENVSLPSIEEWLWLIKNAQYVVTDSFHGMVFSIIFHIPFVVIANNKRGTDRFESLLNILELEDRLGYKAYDIQEKFLMPIDWRHVDILLQKYREESITFLRNGLNLSQIGQ